MHHIRTVDADDNCFRVTVNSTTIAGVVVPSYDVEILRPIELFHDISIPGSWGGNIKITTDRGWN
jgi:hypothetical protein